MVWELHNAQPVLGSFGDGEGIVAIRVQSEKSDIKKKQHAPEADGIYDIHDESIGQTSRSGMFGFLYTDANLAPS